MVAAVVATLLMWPVLGAPHQRVYGEPSDPLGEIWRLEQFRTGEIGLVGNRIAQTANVPDGVELRRALDVTQVLYDLPAVALAKLMPAVPAYNLLVWLALWTSAVAAAWALARLGVRWEGALAGGIAFMVAPVHMIEAQLHVGLAFTAPLPIVLAIGVAVLRRPTVRGGALLGAVAAACAYVTAYLSLQVLAVLAGLVVTAVAVGIAHPGRRGPLLRAVAAAGGAGAVVLLPLAVVFATSRARIDEQVARPLEDLAAFSLSPAQFVDPRLSSYLGLAGIAAAVGGLVWGRGGRTLRFALAAVTLSGLWMALSPEAPVVGPLAPASVIHSVFPYWRVYGRAEIVAALGIAALAGLAVARLAERPGGSGRVLAALLAGVVVGDVLRQPPPVAADLGRQDPSVDWLRGARAAVAEYPLYGFQDYRLGPVLFRQMRHDRPLLNGGMEGTRSAELTAAASSDGAAQALSALRIAGVERIVVDAGVPDPPGLITGPSLGSGRRGFAVPPGDGAVVIADSAYGEEPGPAGRSFRWLSDGASLRVLSSCDGAARVRLTAVSHSVPRVLTLGTVRFTVGTTPTAVELRVDVGADGTLELPVTTVPAPAPLPGGDPRVAGIGVSGLSAVVRCGP